MGILAHSADGAALCFLDVVREGARVPCAVPTLDSTRLLAREAVATAIADGAPQWRGGPIG